jgi:serpin B
LDGAEDPGAPDEIELVRSALTRETAPVVAASDAMAFGNDSRDFAFELYAQAAEQAGATGNTFISPYSVRVALAMQFAGARGQTRTEMQSALRFNLPEPTLHQAFNSTDLALAGRGNELVNPESSGDLVLRLVNGAFGNKDVEFQSAFLDTLATHYGAGMFAADFAGAPEEQRLAINDWVEENTNERIVDLLPPNSIDESVALVLVNTIYFKGSWLDEFDPTKTQNEVFHAPDGDVMVSMMNGYAEQYAEGDGYQALELPYIAPAVRMLFILPAEGRFDEMEGGLDRAFFDQVRGAMSRWSVTLKVPKFSFETSFGLTSALQAMGIQQLFQAGVADLSGIAGAPGDLYVSDTFHSTFVAVDEQGTEAAAATAIVTSTTSAPPPAEFFLDRPFLFAIVDDPTGQVLFVGRVMQPGGAAR